ncbi:MAG: hypothetical protein JW993_19445 [Sedimentisphaerales bacterium]|nr:hypothetical protein [Sedimentisphaerales bacterium]
MAAVGLKANRNRRVLLLLIPLAVVNLAYLLLRAMLDMSSSSAIQFDALLQSLVVGVTLLWLVVPALGRRGVVRMAAAFVLFLAVAGLSVISYGTASSEETTVFMVFLGTIGGVLILAPAAASRLCRTLYRPGPFMLWLAVWMIVAGVAAMLVAFAVLLSVLPSGPSASEIPGVILQAIVAGAIIGLCLYALSAPYMLLGFLSPFFRARLQACLNLRPTADSESAASFVPADARL